MKAIRLQTEYLNKPLGLGDPTPRFFWNCEGGVTQTAYRIVARRDGETVWDSGKVSSASMTHIQYGGKPLHSRDIVYWSVTLWDENDEPGEEAESRFELGLLESADWRAKWISGNYRPRKNVRYPVDCFKKTFAADGEIKKARLYASARGVYDMTLNGHRIEDFILAPGATDYRTRIQYQTYDVTALLQKNNELVLRLADGWYRGSVAAYGVTNVFGSQTSLTAQLEIAYADGRTETIVTDGTWKWSNDGALRFADLKDGEVYDANKTPSYSGRAMEVAPPKAAIAASDNVNVSEHERFTGYKINDRVYDFAQNIAGYLSLTVKGKQGDKIKIVCGEMLDENGHVDLSGVQETIPAKGWNQTSLVKKLLTGTVKGKTTLTPKQEITLICSGGKDVYKTSFAVFGFRYAEVFGNAEITDMKAIAVYSDMEPTGDFICSDSRVNKLLENTRWSMKSNFLDAPTDCPTRERLGWTGDAQIFFDTSAFLFNTAPFFAKWLRDMEDAQYKTGLLPAVIPYNGVEMMYKATGASAGWADAVYLIPYRYYRRFGDKERLTRCWPMMKMFAEYLIKKTEKDGHYEKGVHLGEWLEPEEFRDAVNGAKAKHPEACTAYLYYAMTTMAKIADTLGFPADAARCREIAERAKKIYPRYADLDTDRQAKLVRPLALGLLDGEIKKSAERRLKQAAQNYQYKVGTGFLSTPFLLGVLTEAGESETAYKMLLNTEKPGWLHEVEQGATTVWESWEGDASLNHYSPGAVCGWLFDTCAGLRVDGENRFVLAPVPGGTLTFAEARYKSVYGEVKSRWEKTDGKIKYAFTVPSNCAAEIRLPDGRKHFVKTGEYCYEI